jgi:nitrite reductase/ring-hydroxylating ferredoxin subunit
VRGPDVTVTEGRVAPMEHQIGQADEVRRDGCRIIDINGRRVGVISVEDTFFAVTDRCPHMGASMCQGTVGGTFVAAAPHELVYGKDGRVIRCPWHGWEFDLETGRSLLEPERFGLKTYPVTVEDGVVVLHS